MDKYIDVNCERFDEFEVFDLGESQKIMEFLSFLYVQKVNQDNYLLNIVNSLEEIFHISRASITKYVGLDLNAFDELIANPTKHSNKLDAMVRLVNFFNAVSKASI